MRTYDVDCEELQFCDPCHSTPKVQRWLESAENRIEGQWQDDHGFCDNCLKDF